MDLGTYKMHLGKYAEATSAWNKAVQLEPDYFLAYTYLAGFYDENGEFELAIQNYRKVIQTKETVGAGSFDFDEITYDKAGEYTYTVKARKVDGREGFLLVYNYQNERDFDWFNVGGWGNSQNAIEQSVDGGRINIGQETRFMVDSDRWYDLRVDVEGDSVTAFIDGKQEIAARHKNPNMRGIYANSTLDEKTNTLYIKVVNVGEGSTQGCVNLSNAVAQRAGMVRLASESGQDENTRIDPMAIHPRHIGVFVERDGHQLKFPVAAFSVNIITVNLK